MRYLRYKLSGKDTFNQKYTIAIKKREYKMHDLGYDLNRDDWKY
jgi:hypothetical protein